MNDIEQDEVDLAKSLKKFAKWKEEAAKRGNKLVLVEIPILILKWLDTKMSEKGFSTRSQVISNILLEALRSERKK